MTGPASRGAADAAHPWQWPDDPYTVRPPWGSGHPPSAFLGLARSGAVRGRVLDVGCGTGEHVLMCAGLGLDATGIDLAATAPRTTGDKARRYCAHARFPHHDARSPADLGERFDTVLDCGMLHLPDPDDRPAFTAGLRAVLHPGGRSLPLCFSDREPRTLGTAGPHRLTRDDLTDTFADGLHVDCTVPATIEIILDGPASRPGSPR
ncbi:class I SAM-dependent methyltransferase [Streptomyces sp. MMG1121]|uniref:class I SAM-dependent methyltransferase n=1 Tax=Streptomyces sp. MMG1121 TaxID=1415544 RepID=UPI0018FEA9D4|nr:class I SAM-dependent methyltransferase [Streptomyces sp. MMG1121]